MISASPDGITPDGIMIEIKVPLRRHITGIPPIYYWMQMQQQLQVCSLDKVDFVECDIKEYLNNYEFMIDRDDKNDYNEPITKSGHFKNVIIEYHKLDENDSNYSIGWIYPDKILKCDEIDDWINHKKTELTKSNDKLFARIIYFRVETYSVCEIWRDDEWWEKNKKEFVKFWEKVEYYRKNGYNELIKPKRNNKYVRKKKIPECLIVTSEDDNIIQYSNNIKNQDNNIKNNKVKCLIIDSDSD
jgi:hypothetical protein